MIIKDTREQQGWDFNAYGIDMIIAKIDTGDYTFSGMQDKVFIERKKSISELSTNLGKDSKRFFNELERTRLFLYKYIICEFPAEDILNFPNVDCIPKKVRKYIIMNSKFIISRIEFIENEYGITFFFCNNTEHAERVVLELYAEITK